MRVLISVLFAFAVFVGCGKGWFNKTKEEPRFIDSPRNLGITQTIPFDELIKKPRFKGETPWTDSFWPNTHLGLAWRYHDPSKPKFPKISEIFEEMYSALASKDTERIALLSPAEKYDALFLKDVVIQDIAKNPTMNKFRQQTKVLESKLQAYDKKAAKLLRSELTFEEGVLEGKRFRGQFPLLANSILEWSKYAGSQKYSLLGSENEAEKQDGWDWTGHCHGWAAAATVEEEPKRAVSVVIGGVEIFFFESDLRGLITKSWSEEGVPAEDIGVGARCEVKLKEIPLDADDGRVLDGLICRRTPDGKFIDSECLYQNKPMTRTWYSGIKDQITMNGPEEGIISFEIDTYQHPSKDGSGVYRAGKKDKKYALPVFPDADSYRFAKYDNVADRSAAFGLFHKYFGDHKPESYLIEAYIFDDKESMQDFVKSPDFRFVPAVLTVSGCRDVNPATFHLALSEYLNDGGDGKPFVLDITRTQQVWNQPVYAYDSDIDTAPLQSVFETRDDLAAKRAPGTRYLQEVTTKITYLYEPGTPIVSYTTENGEDLDDDAEHNRTYLAEYTLEYDGGRLASDADLSDGIQVEDFKKSPKLIGAEWGHLGDETSRFNDQAPDFIFGYDKTRKPQRSWYDVQFLRKLHECSTMKRTDIPPENIKNFEFRGRSIEYYYDCKIK